MSAERLGWLGVRTDRFKQMTALYRDLLGLEGLSNSSAAHQKKFLLASQSHSSSGSTSLKPLPALLT